MTAYYLLHTLIICTYILVHLLIAIVYTAWINQYLIFRTYFYIRNCSTNETLLKTNMLPHSLCNIAFD